MKIYTGKEIVEKYVNIQNDVFADEREFLLEEIHKEELYDCVCWDGSSKNLKTYEEWEKDDDNYDQYHTNTIDEMVSFIKNGGELPPLIVNKDYGLYDGQHRLTAYSLIDDIETIKVFKEL